MKLELSNIELIELKGKECVPHAAINGTNQNDNYPGNF